MYDGSGTEGVIEMISILLTRTIIQLFVIMFLGYLLVALKLLKASDSYVLSLISMYVVMPCVIVKSFLLDTSSAAQKGFTFVVVFSVIIHVLLIAFGKILQKAFHYDVIERSSIIYTNVGSLVTILVSAVLGDQWVIYVNAFLMVQTIFIWSHGQSMMREERSLNLKKILQNPNMIACFVGIILFLFRIPVPDMIFETMDSITKAMSLVCMLMIGMILSQTKWKEVFKDKKLYMVLIVKMILVPTVMMVILKYTHRYVPIEDSEKIMIILLLCVSTPSALLTTQMAQLYGKDSVYAGEINVLSTLVSIATVPMIISLYYL